MQKNKDTKASDKEAQSGTEENLQEQEGLEQKEELRQDDAAFDQVLEELEQVKNTVDKLEEQNKELKEQFLRKQADFENFRKRMLRDKQDAIKFANSDLLTDLIEVIDDLERAIQSAEASQDFNTLHDGVNMIEERLVGMLEKKYGLKRMETVGQEFDPQIHEAIMMEPSEEVDEPQVVENFMRGYLLHDRVLRNAKVKVATPMVKTDQEVNQNE